MGTATTQDQERIGMGSVRDQYEIRTENEAQGTILETRRETIQ